MILFFAGLFFLALAAFFMLLGLVIAILALIHAIVKRLRGRG